MTEHHDAAGRLTIEFGEDGYTLQVYATRLEEMCKGTQIQRSDSPDQRYWDYDVEGTRIVLHSDVFAGVALYVGDGSRGDLLRRVARQIARPKGWGE